MPTAPPDPEKVALALHLRRTQPEMSLAQIAEQIGVRSPTTASNYIALAEQHETWEPVVNRATIGYRWDLVTSTVLDRLLARLDDPEVETERTARAIAEYLTLIAKRHGLNAPVTTQNQTVDGAAPPIPNPEMTAAIQAALVELDAADRRSGLNGDDR